MSSTVEHVAYRSAAEQVLFDHERDFLCLHPVVPDLLPGLYLQDHQHRSIAALAKAAGLLQTHAFSQPIDRQFMAQGVEHCVATVAATGAVLAGKNLDGSARHARPTGNASNLTTAQSAPVMLSLLQNSIGLSSVIEFHTGIVALGSLFEPNVNLEQPVCKESKPPCRGFV